MLHFSGLDLAGGVSITYQVVGEGDPSAEDMADTIYKLQRRVESYSNESQVYQEGSDRINIEIPGVSDANAILDELGKPGSLMFLDSADTDRGSQPFRLFKGSHTGDDCLAVRYFRLHPGSTDDCIVIYNGNNIFARIREELATGKTVQSAIKIGFEKAFSAILDGNVTTLIAALVLGIKGSGTVKGFLYPEASV